MSPRTLSHTTSPAAPCRVAFGEGSVGLAGAELDRLGARSVFLVAGARSFVASGAEAGLSPALAGRRVVRCFGRAPRPCLDEVRRAIDAFRASGCDAVVGVGGGTALDLAKLVRFLADQADDPLAVVEGRAAPRPPSAPLLLLPTTAGSGSEATRFAVLYDGHRKYSLDHPGVKAESALVDPDLTAAVPREQAAASGLDALCQAAEACWSVRSTPESTADALEALSLARRYLEAATLRPTPVARRAMARAAHLAGRAIDAARTTAPHAVSYYLSTRYGVAHGHAVALTFGAFLVHNSRVGPADVTDPRGPAHVRESVGAVVRALGCRGPEHAAASVRSLCARLGLAPTLAGVGVGTHAEILDVARHVNPDRLGNNPRAVTPDDLARILAAAR